MAQGKTFGLNGEDVIVEIVAGPFSTGLCKVQATYDDDVVTLVRHKDRIVPMDDEAIKLLEKDQ